MIINKKHQIVIRDILGLFIALNKVKPVMLQIIENTGIDIFLDGRFCKKKSLSTAPFRCSI